MTEEQIAEQISLFVIKNYFDACFKQAGGEATKSWELFSKTYDWFRAKQNQYFTTDLEEYVKARWLKKATARNTVAP